MVGLTGIEWRIMVNKKQNEHLAKYRRLSRDMISSITNGTYEPGSRFPSEHEWAKQYSVSRHTVRQALQKVEIEGWLIRQQGKGTFVRRPPSDIYRGSRRLDIGVLIPCVTISLYPGVVRGVEDVCVEEGYHVILSNYDTDSKKERNQIARLAAKQVAGLISCPSFNSKPSNYGMLLDHQVPLVLVDTTVDGVDADLVSTDNFKGAILGTERLISLGCRSLAFISGFFSASTSRERLAGFKVALERNNMEPDADLIMDGPFSDQFGYEATLKLLAGGKRADGIFVANDPIATGVIQALRQKRIKIPDDIHVCSFDEPNLPMLPQSSLIVVQQQRYETGCIAARTLLSRIAEKSSGAKRVPSQAIRIAPRILDWPSNENDYNADLTTASVYKQAGE